MREDKLTPRVNCIGVKRCRDVRNGIDSLYSFVERIGYKKVRHFHKLKSPRLNGILEDFPEMVRLVQRPDSPANGVPMFEKLSDEPGRDESVRTCDEDLVSRSSDYHCEIGFDDEVYLP